MNPIYLDYNATTPISAEVREAMLPYLDNFFGNPSSTYSYGAACKKAVEQARARVADALGCNPDEIIFTSGGSESDNYAIKGAALANRSKGNHIITSKIEHYAVLEPCKYLEQQGFRVTYLPVDQYGMVDLATLESAITPETILITLMHANNEVGTIQPLAEISAIAKRHSILFHTDAAQSIGKIPTKVSELGVDLLTVAAHKFYAPKGVGALYVRRGVVLEKLIHGAGHERGLRAGTENVMQVVALGKAMEDAAKNLSRYQDHTKKLRDRLHQGLIRELGEKNVHLNGHPELRLPNTLSVSFPKVDASTLLSAISDRVAASAGAACHVDDVTLSHVLEAMGVPVDIGMGTVRLSTGLPSTEAEIDTAIKVISEAVKPLLPADSSSEDAELACVLPTGPVRLTTMTHGLGCGCKMRPQALEKVLQGLKFKHDENVLVGTETADDAGVYKLTPEIAIVQTVDFFTPVVDSAYDFGAIACANSLSDVYAMGGEPVTALNIVAFPSNRLPLETLREILKGAQDKANEAGVNVLGGHTVEDNEPKYGMSVTGVVHPDKIWKNVGVRPGDVLILTKPIGVGIITTAAKRGLASEEVVAEAVKAMSTLNKYGKEVAIEFPVHACTDVTGFGLLGHLKELTQGSKINTEIWADQVPILPGAREFAAADVIPGGTANNLIFTKSAVQYDPCVDSVTRTLLCDAQTSGGLVICVPPECEKDLLAALKAHPRIMCAVTIGRCIEEGNGTIFVKNSACQ